MRLVKKIILGDKIEKGENINMRKAVSTFFFSYIYLYGDKEMGVKINHPITQRTESFG